jgi:hypothetical protein
VKTLATPGTVDEVIARIARLDPASERRWGTLTPNEMLCHLADSYGGMLGDRIVTPVDTVLTRTVFRWVALHTALPWPKGVPTRPEVDPRQQGTQPVDFDRDRDAVVALIRRFITPGARYAHHPFFGSLTRREWLIWGYRHPDHHLRQFGI